MTETPHTQTASMPPQAELPPLVLAARKLLLDLRQVHVPDGTIKQRLQDEIPIDKKTGQPLDVGLKLLLHAVSGFMVRQPSANPAVLRRLDNSDGLDITDILSDIATNPPDLELKKQQLRLALQVKGKPLFDELLLEMQAAGRSRNTPDADAPDSGQAPPGKRGRGWRDELNKPKGAPPDVDSQIHDEAVQWDREHDGVSPDYLHRQAKRYDKDHHLGDEQIKKEASEWERDHHIDDKGIRRSADLGLSSDEHFDGDKPKKTEAAAYAALVQTLKDEFERVLAPAMQQGGVGGVGTAP